MRKPSSGNSAGKKSENIQNHDGKFYVILSMGRVHPNPSEGLAGKGTKRRQVPKREEAVRVTNSACQGLAGISP